MHFVRLQLFPPATLEPNMKEHFKLNSSFALALFTILGLHLDLCNCVSRSLPCCQLNLVDSDCNFVIGQSEPIRTPG